MTTIKYLYIVLGIITIALFSGCASDPAYVIPDDSVRDNLTGAILTISSTHEEVHEGHMYTVSDTVVADTTTVKWQIHTSDTKTYAHVVFSLFVTGEATYLVTEGSDRVDGTALQEVNKRRVGTMDVSETVVTRTPTGGTTDGDITLFSVRTGATGVASKTLESGEVRAESEWILKPSTKYVISITTYAAAYATCKLDWYEHTEK